MKLLFIISMLATTTLAMAKTSLHPGLSLQRYSNTKHYDATRFWARVDTAILSALIKVKSPRLTKFLSNVLVLDSKTPSYAMLRAAKTNNTDNIELLLRIGANPITALLLAAHEKNHSAAMFILEEVMEPYCEYSDTCLAAVLQATVDRKEDVAKFIMTEIADDHYYLTVAEALIIMPDIKKAQSEQLFFTQEDAQFLLSLSEEPSTTLTVALEASSREQNKQAAKFIIELGADTENMILMAIAIGRPKIALFLVKELGIDPTRSLVKAIKENYPDIEAMEEALLMLGADLQHEDVLAAKDNAPQKDNSTAIDAYHSDARAQYLKGAINAQIDKTINGFTELLIKMILPLQETALAQLNSQASKEEIYMKVNKYLNYDYHNKEQQEKMKQQTMAELNAEPELFEQLVAIHLLVTKKISELRLITKQKPDNITLQETISKCQQLLTEHKDLFDILTYQKLEDFLLQLPQNKQELEATLPSEITLPSGKSLPLRVIGNTKSSQFNPKLN